MNKRIKVAVITIVLCGLPILAHARDLMAPGSSFNPYVIQQRSDGKAEVSTQYYDFNKGLSSPGQPTNPYVIERHGDGRTTIQQQFLNFEDDGSSDD